MKHTKLINSFPTKACMIAVTAAVLISGAAITTFAAASMDVAINGKPIVLTPATEDGYVYAGCTVSWTDDAGNTHTAELSEDELQFYMPTEDIVITPKFVPESAVNSIDDSTALG